MNEREIITVVYEREIITAVCEREIIAVVYERELIKPVRGSEEEYVLFATDKYD